MALSLVFLKQQLLQVKVNGKWKIVYEGLSEIEPVEWYEIQLCC